MVRTSRFRRRHRIHPDMFVLPAATPAPVPQACADEVRHDMLGRGFALVDTPEFYELESLLELAKTRMVLPFDSKRWCRFPALARFACWLEALLGEALPEESVALAELEFRQESADKFDPQIDRLHADGSYIRALCTLCGPSTVYRNGGIELSVPSGQTLLMTAMHRARAIGVPCTLHRRPSVGIERAVIVCSLEPCAVLARPTAMYRLVALAG